jgi:hypothetical protein
MKTQMENYALFGRATPYRPDNPTILLAEISIRGSRLQVELLSETAGRVRCVCVIWEHTIYELETLCVALRATAREPFPQSHQVPTPKSGLGQSLQLFPSVDLEVGYSLDEPGATRARFFCSSKRHYSNGSLLVRIGVAVSGAFAEIVVAPSQASEFADWLDRQIAMLWPDAYDGTPRS